MSERLKRNIPVPESMPAAYRIRLRKERMVKPASVTYRNDILRRTQRANYINEYDRLAGEIAKYSRVFGHMHTVEKLKSRQTDLKKLFKDSHET
jgi:hypothetical protein